LLDAVPGLGPLIRDHRPEMANEIEQYFEKNIQGSDDSYNSAFNFAQRVRGEVEWAHKHPKALLHPTRASRHAPEPTDYYSAHPAAKHALANDHKDAQYLLSLMKKGEKQAMLDYEKMAKIMALMRHAASIGDTKSVAAYKKQGVAAQARYMASLKHVNSLGNDYAEKIAEIQNH